MAKAALLPLLDGLEPISDVMARLKERLDHRRDVEVREPIDLNFRWRDSGYGVPEARFYMTIDGADMPLTDGAEYTASVMIGQKDPKWFRRFGDPDFFPKSFRNYGHTTGFVVRHDGHEVQAVLPDTYRVTNAYDLLNDDFLPLLNDSFGQVRGVQHVSEGFGDMDAFRIVAGPNVVGVIGAEQLGQHMMFMLATSENGLRDTRSWIGLYRSISRSSALRGQTVSRWSHKVSPETFLNRTTEMVRGMEAYQKSFGDVLEAMTRTPMPLGELEMPMPVSDVLRLLKRGKLVTQAHYDAAKIYTTQLTEDGRPYTSQYDLFVACTRGAADIPNQRLREKAEEICMKLFMESGGLEEQIRRAMERTPDMLED